MIFLKEKPPKPKEDEEDAEWISVKDRLPEKEQEVFCCSSKGDLFIGKYLGAGHVKGIAVFVDTGRWYIKGTTHWMPLPSPPNTEE